MTVTIPRSPSMAYQLADSLLEEPAATRISTPPNESEREELLLKKLGARGWGRIYHFRHFYGPGWGEANGKQLSPRALEAFFRFLERIEIPSTRKPSVFLTDDGHLELCWEDRGQKAVQVEFTPQRIEFYLEDEGREGEASFSEIPSLAGQLNGR